MSKIEVDAIDKQSGSTLTLGGSGTAVTLACGATQSGFGRSGSVNWQTAIKTANFTAASGEGYFCDTNSVGAFTLTLPSSPSVGDIVALKDYASNFATANLTIGRGGSNLNGAAADFTASTDNLSLTLVYADATKGWMSVEEGTGFIGESFMAATGGTITTSGNCKIHTFTAPGTFCVSAVSLIAACNQVSYMVVAGGGGSGKNAGGGGGAGGFREDKSPVTPYTASPLEGAGPITVTATSFPITVGAGGAGSSNENNKGSSGSDSVFSTITSTGGGGGGSGNAQPGATGGSGGGARSNEGAPGGAGNTPPVSPSQGFAGGNTAPSPTPAPYVGGGGGGATTVGASGNPGNGGGGTGATTSINGSPTAFAGGGGGGANGPNAAGPGGAGGGGKGGATGCTPAGEAGTANTGGGAGAAYAAHSPNNGLAGGSGIVIIRYKFQ
jgi:hypothetical protein